MNRQPRPVVGRLAPSPTGGLHLGHARTFLAAWLSARSQNGRVILRIEDIDASRVRPEAIDDAIADLRWLGLDWDEGPSLQSDRNDRYEAALGSLQGRELVYPCTCTRADIARSASAPHAGDEGPSYPGTCAHRSARDAESLVGRPYCWRFRVPAGQIWWDDLLRGTILGDPMIDGGDFLVGRSSGEPSYQLAVVVDDAEMGVTEVLRGDDLILSTPRQILLYRAMGWIEPRFGHIPMVVDSGGRRLAKRDRAIKLSTMREAGADPLRIIAGLAGSLGMTADTPVRPIDLIGPFRMDRIPKSPWTAGLDGLVQSPRPSP